MEMGLDTYHSSSNLTKLVTAKPGRTQNTTNSIKTSASTLEWAQVQRPLMPVGLMWEHGLKKNHSVSRGKLNGGYPTEMEPCLEAPIQEPTQPCHWLKSGVEGNGRGFSNKRRRTLRESLVLRPYRPMKQGGECRGNSQARECQHWHTQLGQVNLTLPDTRQKKKFFGGKVFFQEKWATWL